MVRRSWVYCTLRPNRSQHTILADNRDFCLPNLHSTPALEYCHDVWCGKTRMVWLPDGENIWRYVITQTWRTDGWTDRRTSHDSIGRVCIVSRSKKTWHQHHHHHHHHHADLWFDSQLTATLQRHWHFNQAFDCQNTKHNKCYVISPLFDLPDWFSCLFVHCSRCLLYQTAKI